MSTKIAEAPHSVSKVEPCFKARDGIVVFLCEYYTTEQLENLNVSHPEVPRIAGLLYERHQADVRVMNALRTVNKTSRCHTAVFAAAIHEINKVVVV